MKTTQQERKVDRVENMAGGKGHVILDHLLTPEQLAGKCRLFANVTLAPGCTLGVHGHTGETETYYITAGEGLYHDNDTSYPVKAGDVTFCADGGTHGLDNTGTTDLVFTALIIKG